MSVVDLITRIDAICKKYDRYDLEKHRDPSNNVSGSDAFARLYGAVESEIDALLQAAENENSRRLTVVAMNAEIRRTKTRLLEELPKLQRLAIKKVKGVSKEELETRNDLVAALKERIGAIKDGTTDGVNPSNGGTT